MIKLRFLALLFLLYLTTTSSAARFAPPRPHSQLSDGTPQDTRSSVPNFLRQSWYKNSSAMLSSSSCDATFGFMPCSDTALGNVFLIGVYGYLMYMGATCLVHGSESLEEILGPGVIGGLLLPILATLPDAMLVLASGLSGSTETAQSQISVGMGLMAGSTVLILTVMWGTCAVLGKCDLDSNSNAIDGEDTKGFHLTGAGVSTDIWTSYAARIMVVSVVPFIAVQVAQIFNSSSTRQIGVLISLIISLSLLVSYCVYQVFRPWIQERRIAYVKLKHMMVGFIKHLRKHSLGKLIGSDGKPNNAVIEKLFCSIDSDNDNNVSRDELRAFLVGVELDEENMVEHIIKEFDMHGNSLLDLDEFKAGISKWLVTIENSTITRGSETSKRIDCYQQSVRHENMLLGSTDIEDVVVEYEMENSEKNKGILKSVSMLLIGTLMAAIFSDPLVDAVNEFSTVTGIPSFFIAFIVLPFVTSTSDAIPSFTFSRRKKRDSTSLTYSMLYGSVTMNNVLSLSVFLALVYFRGLTWNFTSEMLVILMVCVVMGGLASFRTCFPLWTSIIAFSLYPFSLLLVYVLDYVCGWS